MRVGERLGDAASRRRRHVKVAVLGAALLALGAVLVFAVDDEGDPTESFTAAANATCERYSERIDREFELSFPDGPPNQAAVEEYLSRAFADTMDDLVGELRALDGVEAASDVLDDLAARVLEVRSDPAPFASQEREISEGIATQFDELGLTACGSEFLDSSS